MIELDFYWGNYEKDLKTCTGFSITQYPTICSPLFVI